MVRLIKMSNDKMNGVLARAGKDPQGIYIDINGDHPFITEVLDKNSVINKAAFDYMVLAEIAMLIVQELDNCEDENEKIRKMVRCLFDIREAFIARGKAEVADEAHLRRVK